MMTDLRFAFRQLVKSPGFTLLALITLALGIGLNTAIFSLINDVFLRGLPFQEPERIVHVFANRKEAHLTEIAISAPRFMHYRDGQTIFAGFAAENGAGFTLTGVGDPVQLNGSRVTPNYFEVLGVRPIKGRHFLPNEEEGADVALITENFWRKRLGGDENVIGRSITLEGVAHTIVGVLPNQPAAWFGAQPPAEVFATKPFSLPGFSHERIMRGTGFLRVIARLKPGQTIEQARAALPPLDHSYQSQYPDKMDSGGFCTIKNIPEDVNGNLRPAFATLLAAVGFVLLIACSNVANLLLVRFSGRRREIALRIAIGASRTSVVRLFIFESLLVSLLSGFVGALVAWQLVPLVPKITSNFLPLEPNYDGPGFSVPVLSFNIALSILTGLVMGLYPALQSSRADLVDGLKEGGRGTSGSVRQQRFRKILVGAQVALSVTLLAGAALLITSFIKLSKQNMGFRADHLWTGFITLPQAAYPDIPARQRFVEKSLAALKTVSGFESVSISSDIPLNGGGRALYTRPEGDVPPIDKRPACPTHEISTGYFRTWGIQILSGRDIDERDIEGRQNVILISQAGARKLFGSENPIGHTLLITGSNVPAEIVGIFADVRSQRPREANDMEYYRPWAQENFPFLSIAVRSNIKPETVTKSVQSALNGIDPAIAIALPQSMDQVVTQALGQARLMMILLGIFAGVALLLASIGIYGAVAYTVEQRTGEIGVRMALGAQTADILRLIVNQGMRPVIFGLVAGLAVALGLGHLLTSQLYQVSAHNPVLLIGTAATLGAAALLACLLPARRASLLNPVVALRAE
jgi:putative ABC transport system permease protein